MRPLSMEIFIVVIGLRRNGLVYLVDWDSVRLTDRMFDVPHMLCRYIQNISGRKWLTYYGYKYNQTVLNKLYWYGQLYS